MLHQVLPPSNRAFLVSFAFAIWPCRWCPLLRRILLKNSVLRLRENSCKFFLAGLRVSQLRFELPRRSGADFHVLTTTLSYLEYEKTVKSQIKLSYSQNQSFSTESVSSGPSTSYKLTGGQRGQRGSQKKLEIPDSDIRKWPVPAVRGMLINA